MTVDIMNHSDLDFILWGSYSNQPSPPHSPSRFAAAPIANMGQTPDISGQKLRRITQFTPFITTTSTHDYYSERFALSPSERVELFANEIHGNSERFALSDFEDEEESRRLRRSRVKKVIQQKPEERLEVPSPMSDTIEVIMDEVVEERTSRNLKLAAMTAEDGEKTTNKKRKTAARGQINMPKSILRRSSRPQVPTVIFGFEPEEEKTMQIAKAPATRQFSLRSKTTADEKLLAVPKPTRRLRFARSPTPPARAKQSIKHSAVASKRSTRTPFNSPNQPTRATLEQVFKQLVQAAAKDATRTPFNSPAAAHDNATSAAVEESRRSTRKRKLGGEEIADEVDEIVCSKKRRSTRLISYAEESESEVDSQTRKYARGSSFRR